MNALDIEPTKPEFLSRTRGGNLIPVSCELSADLETPISTFMKVRGGGDAFLLESVEGGERIGRYSFIGSRPMMTIVSRGEQVEIREGSSGDGAESLRVERQTADVLEVTRNILHRHRPVPDPSLPRFAGGAVGDDGGAKRRHLVLHRQDGVAKRVLEDDRDRVGVREDVLQRGAALRGIDRHRVRSDEVDAEMHPEELRAVAHHDRHAVARFDAESEQAVGGAL